MTSHEFIEKIRNAYLKARNCSYQPVSNSHILRRGTSHTISSIAEDIFAGYCVEKVSRPEDYEVIADPQISFSGTELRNINDKKSLLIRPDVAICKNKTVTCLFDLKMDLGYNRSDFMKQAITKNQQINLIKNRNAKINGEVYFISPDIMFNYLLLSEKNGLKGLHSQNMVTIKTLENIDAFILSDGDHLNSYNLKSTFTANELEFNRLDSLLDKHLN